jgi:hypothetical protein
VECQQQSVEHVWVPCPGARIEYMAARCRPDLQIQILLRPPIAQDYGTREAAVHDPAGNLIRIQALPKGLH